MDRHGTTLTVMPIDIPGRSNMYRVVISRNTWRGSKCIQSTVDLDVTMADLTYTEPGKMAHAIGLQQLATQIYYGRIYPTPPRSDGNANPYPPVASDTPTPRM